MTMRHDNFFKQSIMAQVGAAMAMQEVCRRLTDLGVGYTVIQDSIHVDRVPDGVVLDMEKIVNESFLSCGELRSLVESEQEDVREAPGGDHP